MAYDMFILVISCAIQLQFGKENLYIRGAVYLRIAKALASETQSLSKSKIKLVAFPLT